MKKAVLLILFLTALVGSFFMGTFYANHKASIAGAQGEAAFAWAAAHSIRINKPDKALRVLEHLMAECVYHFASFNYLSESEHRSNIELTKTISKYFTSYPAGNIHERTSAYSLYHGLADYLDNPEEYENLRLEVAKQSTLIKNYLNEHAN